MRTPTRSALPTEPLESALGTARDVALTARDKGLELLETEAAQDLLRRGQHIAFVARDRGAELLESDAAHELRRRSRDVVSAARGDLIPTPTRSRRSVGMLLFAAGAVAGVAAAIVSKRMSTPVPEALATSYEDPAAQFPSHDGIIDLTSVAAEEGVGERPVQDLAEISDVEVGATTGATKAAAGTSSSNGSTRSRRSAGKPTEGSSAAE